MAGSIKRTLTEAGRKEYLRAIAQKIVAKLGEERGLDRLHFQRFEISVCNAGITVGASLPDEYNSLIFSMPLLTEANGFVRLIERAHFAIRGSENYAEAAVANAVRRVSEADAFHAKKNGLPEKPGRIAGRERQEMGQEVGQEVGDGLKAATRKQRL